MIQAPAIPHFVNRMFAFISGIMICFSLDGSGELF